MSRLAPAYRKFMNIFVTVGRLERSQRRGPRFSSGALTEGESGARA